MNHNKFRKTIQEFYAQKAQLHTQLSFLYEYGYYFTTRRRTAIYSFPGSFTRNFPL